jgi:hypothetical protein
VGGGGTINVIHITINFILFLSLSKINLLENQGN